MTSLPNKTPQESHQRTSGKKISKKCGQQPKYRAGGRWRQQQKTELDGNSWSVAGVPSTEDDTAY